MGAVICPLWGPRFVFWLFSAQAVELLRSGGMPGGSAKRGRRAEGPEEPAGGLPPKRRRGLAWFIHRQRSPQGVKEFIS